MPERSEMTELITENYCLCDVARGVWLHRVAYLVGWLLLIVRCVRGLGDAPIWVSPSGSDSVSCGSTLDPCQSIMYAIAGPGQSQDQPALMLTSGLFPVTNVLTWTKSVLVSVTGAGSGVGSAASILIPANTNCEGIFALQSNSLALSSLTLMGVNNASSC